MLTTTFPYLVRSFGGLSHKDRDVLGAEFSAEVIA